MFTWYYKRCSRIAFNLQGKTIWLFSNDYIHNSDVPPHSPPGEFSLIVPLEWLKSIPSILQLMNHLSATFAHTIAKFSTLGCKNPTFLTIFFQMYVSSWSESLAKRLKDEFDCCQCYPSNTALCDTKSSGESLLWVNVDPQQQVIEDQKLECCATRERAHSLRNQLGSAPSVRDLSSRTIWGILTWFCKTWSFLFPYFLFGPSRFIWSSADYENLHKL